MGLARLAALLTAFALAAAPLAAAKEEGPFWQRQLETRLMLEHDCMMIFFTGVLEREVDGKVLTMARAHCEDRRAFDASRRGIGARFEINECTVSAC